MSQDVETMLNRVVDVLLRLVAPKRIILIGSQGRDYEIAFEGAVVDQGLERKMRFALEDAVEGFNVALVNLDEAPPHIRKAVLQQGRVLHGAPTK